MAPVGFAEPGVGQPARGVVGQRAGKVLVRGKALKDRKVGVGHDGIGGFMHHDGQPVLQAVHHQRGVVAHPRRHRGDGVALQHLEPCNVVRQVDEGGPLHL